MLRPYRKGNGWRRHGSQDGQHWESPALGWSSRLCTDKDSNHRGLMRWRISKTYRSPRCKW